MHYTPTPLAPPGYFHACRLYDTIMKHIDMDLASWNYGAFKLYLLSLSPEERSQRVAEKQASLMKYRKHLILLEQSLSGYEQQNARGMMQVSGDLEELKAMEQELQNL